MKGLPEFPSEQQGAGDVLSHLSASLDIGEKLPNQTMGDNLHEPHVDSSLLSAFFVNDQL
jgi:hypothetical protein